MCKSSGVSWASFTWLFSGKKNLAISIYIICCTFGNDVDSVWFRCLIVGKESQGFKDLEFCSSVCNVENVERDESRIFEYVKILHMLLIY